VGGQLQLGHARGLDDQAIKGGLTYLVVGSTF
jgi:hypothetical protein